MKTKKNPFSKSRRMAFLWGTVIVIFAVSCHDEMFYNPESRNSRSLDHLEIEPGTFVGEYAGGEWQISLPNPIIWNSLPQRYLMFYAHGIVDPVPFEEVKLPDDNIGGRSVERILLDRGFGYASTSYSDNGLVVLEAVEDVKKLVELAMLFFEVHPDYSAPDFLFLGGPSEGGLVTVKTIEKYGHLFDGAISICGPIGNFQKQLQYNGDFHVLFNYFFGEELLSNGIDLGNPRDGVHPVIMEAWKSGYLQNNILIPLMMVNLRKVQELLITAKATVDMENPLAMGTAVLELLRFNIMLTNDVQERMRGVPYNNKNTVYSGSANDELLNENVQRIDEPDYQKVKNNIRKYETSGKLIKVPLVTIHTNGDYIIPFWHEELYASKIFPARNSYLHKSIPVVNFGHCTISEADIEQALAFLIGNVTSVNDLQMNEREF